MNITSKKNLKIFIFVLVAVITLGVGYAAITAITLNIKGTGTASAVQENFKVHFTGTPTVTKDMGSATISAEDDTVANLTVTGLSKKGDTAKAVYTVINESNGVGASISLGLTNSNTNYFKVTEKINDTQIKAGETTIVTITVELIKTPIEDGISTTIQGTLEAIPIDNGVAIKGTEAEKINPAPNYFASDSWSTIQTNIQSGNASRYNIGDTKKVTINGDEYTVRIANKSTYDWCDDENYSQTACGFVVEFTDIITEMKMRDTQTNDGGYPESLVYAYLRDTLYNQLPTDLQNIIISTRVVSGFRSTKGDDKIFTSNDQIYLLSQKEIYNGDTNDLTSSQTTQLDYYKIMEVYERQQALKKYNNINAIYWLRASYFYYGFYGFEVCGLQEQWIKEVDGECGVSPAFRIG